MALYDNIYGIPKDAVVSGYTQPNPPIYPYQPQSKNYLGIPSNSIVSGYTPQQTPLYPYAQQQTYLGIPNESIVSGFTNPNNFQFANPLSQQQGIIPQAPNTSNVGSTPDLTKDIAKTALGTALPYGTLALGAVETLGGLYGLSQMGESPTSQISPEYQRAYNNAMQYANQGFTNEERGAYLNNRNTQSATAYQRGMEGSDGSQSGAIKAALNAQNIGADLNYASQDAQRQMQNRQYADSFASGLQQQQNLISAEKRADYQAKQAAYGGAVQAGLGQAASAINLLSLL